MANLHELNLMADLHSKAYISVTGPETSIDILKNLLIESVPDVKSIRIFDPDTKEYVVKLNYTKLSDMRHQCEETDSGGARCQLWRNHTDPGHWIAYPDQTDRHPEAFDSRKRTVLAS